MARLVVGGVDCFVDETQATLGHVVVPLRDLVAFGIVERTQEMVFAYDRRSGDGSYRERPTAKRALVTLDLEGDAESLAVLVRARARGAWRGRHPTLEALLGEEPPAAIDRRPLWRKMAFSVGITVAIFLVGCLLLVRR